MDAVKVTSVSFLRSGFGLTVENPQGNFLFACKTNTVSYATVPYSRKGGRPVVALLTKFVYKMTTLGD